MMLSKDVFSQGARSVLYGVHGHGVHGHGVHGHGVHGVTWPKFNSRRILAGAPTEFMVLAGAIAAPVLSLVGWVGLILPPDAGLHQAAAELLAGGVVGLGTALIGAHACKACAVK